MSRRRINFDNSWKEVLERFYEYFMAFFFPDVHQEIDWNKGYQFLDQELSQFLEDAKLTHRLVDKLVKVWLKTGNEIWVLIHIEVQTQWEKEFSMRMFLYNTLIFHRFKKPVATLVILGDNSPRWKPDNFGYTICRNKMSFQFSSVKLLDYRSRWAELEASTNPFAIITMAQLKAIETRKDVKKRSDWKYEITKRLLKKGFSTEEIRYIYLFIEIILWLPEDLEMEFQKKIYSYKDEEIMAKELLPHEKYFFAEGKEEGLRLGREEGDLIRARRAVIDVLEARFDFIPNTLSFRISGVTEINILNSILKKAAKADSLDAFEKLLD